jgi:hypothetical protein
LELKSDFVLFWSFHDLFDLQSEVSGLNGATSVSGIRSAAPGLFDSARGRAAIAIDFVSVVAFLNVSLETITTKS